MKTVRIGLQLLVIEKSSLKIVEVWNCDSWDGIGKKIVFFREKTRYKLPNCYFFNIIEVQIKTKAVQSSTKRQETMIFIENSHM